MRRLRYLLIAWLAIAPAALAQRQPRIGYVYPAGGRQGTTFEVVIGGQFLINATNVVISGSGVSAVIAEQSERFSPKEVDQLRQTIGKLQQKRKSGERLTPEEIKTTEEIRKRLMAFERKRTNPALGDFVTLRVTVAADAAPGKRELRLETQFGLSNPLVFSVGQLPEFTKADYKNSPRLPRFNTEALRTPMTETNITLPATLNGQIPPGGVDRYRFRARVGQPLVVAASARELIPYLADAVPGWFQAALTLYDAAGKELAYDDDFRFHPDPVLFYKIPKDGEYVLEIKDALYRGREDFVYRITAGELPFVTGIFPLGGKAGTQTTIAVGGWNLPLNQLTLDLRDQQPGVYPVSVGRHSNRLPFVVDTLPELLEKEPNNAATEAQPVTLPVIINGRVAKPGDWDVFGFEGRAGDVVVAEVCARRLDSPLDSVLKITDADGRQLAFNDDHEDKASGLNTHHADSYLNVTLPTNGVYYVQLGDTQHNGGWAHSYRLRLSAPRPDFELRVVPSSLNVRAGMSAPVTVFALRKDGFAGEIALTLKDAPPGFKLTGARIPANDDKAKFTLAAPAAATRAPVSLRIEGRATIEGREVVRAAVPAEDMMQAFAYRHLVPAQELKVAVAGRNRLRDEVRVVSALPVRIPAGGASRVKISLPEGPFSDRIRFELSESPDGLTIAEWSATVIVLQADAAKVKPGQKGNLIVTAYAERKPTEEQNTAKANRRRIAVGVLPAIPFEITEP